MGQGKAPLPFRRGSSPRTTTADHHSHAALPYARSQFRATVSRTLKPRKRRVSKNWHENCRGVVYRRAFGEDLQQADHKAAPENNAGNAEGRHAVYCTTAEQEQGARTTTGRGGGALRLGVGYLFPRARKKAGFTPDSGPAYAPLPGAWTHR